MQRLAMEFGASTNSRGATNGQFKRESNTTSESFSKMNSVLRSIIALAAPSSPLRASYSFIFGPVIALFATFFITGCGTNVTMIGNARPAISPAAVRIYQTPPRHYERIAIINSSAGTTWIFHDGDSFDEAFARLRSEAAALGANGVLLEEVYDRPVGGLSVGVGGFGYGHHGFYGGSGGVGGPLINRRVQAMAIYVHR